MYNLQNISIKSLDELYTYITELDIYMHYFGDINDNEVWFNSPFRRDSKPSFRVSYYNNHWVWTDFGVSPYPKRAIELVMQLENLNFYQALDYCYNYIKTSDKILHVVNKEKKVSCIISQNFKPIEIEFFKKADITLEDLKYYNVYNGEIYMNNLLYLNSSYTNPAFIYMFNIKQEKYQGYQPFKINNKFFNNNISNYTLGFNKLKYRTKLLIITKSYKDILVWNKLGIDAVAPPTEAVFINEIDLNYLKVLYKNIIINFDNDETGVAKSKVFSEKYNLKHFNLPKGLEKDPFDFVVNKGYNELLNLLKSKHEFSN